MRIEALQHGKVVAVDQTTGTWSVKKMNRIIKELCTQYVGCEINIIR